MPTIKTEPAIVSGAIVTAAGTAIAVAVSFGAPITDQQSDTILAAIPAWVVLVTMLVVWIRSQVTPNASVVERTEDRNGEQTVVAGEANAIPTGAAIRPLDAHPAFPATPVDPGN